MPVDVVVGGQAGDEGKGKISAYLAHKKNYFCSVRVGGPNAGHTNIIDGKVYMLRTIPGAFVNPKTKLVLGAGCYIKTDWLLDEIKLTKTHDRILIDPNVVIVEESHTQREKSNSHMMDKIGSVGTGLGQAVLDRINRENIKFAKDEPKLKGYICDTVEFLNKGLTKDYPMLVEGTQGMKLSLLHGEYPYVTTRDTTASTFLAEAGLGPKCVRDIYAVFKPYTTRVGPGPLEKEITDESQLNLYHTKGREVGSVSKRKRRIGIFEFANAIKTIRTNQANKIAITHIDMFEGNAGIKSLNELTAEAKKFLDSLKVLSENYPYPKISLISSGPELLDVLEVN
ncbi:MAG TPA: adenylosuccinate synthetase [Elusimicrobiales bacterium]|nr:adenylosuccinate synthetase [Elusimicrobiales bacterium]